MKVLIICMTYLFCCTVNGFGQRAEPVKWTFTAQKISPDTAVLILKATIYKGWHLYSQHLDAGGPIKTSFKFEPSDDYDLIGAVEEPTPIVKLDPVFIMKVNYFENKAIFRQKIKMHVNTTVTVRGSLRFMACNDQQCLPPSNIKFSIPVLATKDTVYSLSAGDK